MTDPGIALGSISFNVSRTLCSNVPSCSGATPVSYGGGSAGAGCGASPPHNVTPATDSPVVATGALSSFAYNQYLGGDLSPALKTSGGQVIVPPASGNTPGTVALYLARPVPTPPRSYVLPWNGSSYRYVVEDAWVKTWEGLLVCCDYDAETKRCYQAEAPSTWSGMRYTRTLTAGTDVLDTSFQLETNGVSSATSIGERSVLPQVVTVSRTIPH